MTLALTAVVFGLVVQDLGEWRAEGAGSVLGFVFPKGPTGRHVRLQVQKPARIWLNGNELAGGPAREFDLDELPASSHRLGADVNPGTSRLLVTPRVFASGATLTETGVSITVRNTLENTASVSVTVRQRGTTGEPRAAATVGPGTALAVLVPGKFTTGRIEVVLQKEEEAVEGQYEFAAQFDMNDSTGTVK
jgi:hypothetical protein